MKFFIHLSLMTFLVVFTIGEFAQSQVRPRPPDGWRYPDDNRRPDRELPPIGTAPLPPIGTVPPPSIPRHPSTERIKGITGVRTGTDGNIELDFRFPCNNILRNKMRMRMTEEPSDNRPPQSNYCPSTLIDDDGMASIVAVLSEMRREAQCDNQNISSSDWRVIRSFLEERANRLKNYCQEAICKRDNNGNLNPNSLFGGIGGAPNVNVMVECGRTVASIERFLSSHGNPYPQAHQLLKLFHDEGQSNSHPSERYHIYNTIHNGRQDNNVFDSVLTRKNDNRTPIANHHSGIKGNTNTKNYFTKNYFSQRISRDLCQGVRQGRLADLLRQRTQQPKGTNSSGGEGRPSRGL